MQHMHAAFTHGMASKTYLTYTMPSTGPNLFAPQMIIRTYIVYWSLHSQVEHHQMKWSTNYMYSLCLLDWAVWPWKAWWEALKLNSSSSTPLRLQGHQRCNSSTGILVLWRSGCRAWDESRTGKHLRSWRNPFLLPSSTLWISPRKKVPRSSWLTSPPIQEFCFTLHKGAFQDALVFWYNNWQPQHTAPTCGCGTELKYALSCPKGGFPSINHNKVRDIHVIKSHPSD